MFHKKATYTLTIKKEVGGNGNVHITVSKEGKLDEDMAIIGINCMLPKVKKVRLQ